MYLTEVLVNGLALQNQAHAGILYWVVTEHLRNANLPTLIDYVVATSSQSRPAKEHTST
jgi:hypothetical protein